MIDDSYYIFNTFFFPDELFNNNRIYKEMFSIEYIR